MHFLQNPLIVCYPLEDSTGRLHWSTPLVSPQNVSPANLLRQLLQLPLGSAYH